MNEMKIISNKTVRVTRAASMLRLFNHGWHVGEKPLTEHTRLLEGMDAFAYDGKKGILLLADDVRDCYVDQLMDEAIKAYKDNGANYLYVIDIVFGLICLISDGKPLKNPTDIDGNIVDGEGGALYV